jgi:hypothetical protein
VRRALALLLLLVLADSHPAHAALVLENRVGADNAETRGLITRLENVLARTEKRIREVFGFKLDMKAVVGPSKEDYDFLFKPPERPGNAKQVGVLLINSRVVRHYSSEDMKIAAGRALYQAVWPKFRKSTASAPVMVQRMYDAGVTAYAAELLYPGAPRWKYAGLFGSEDRDKYRQYLSMEKDLAAEALQTLSSVPDTGFEPYALSGRLLSYRLMKTFEKDLDPKIIQLMGITEFEQRLPHGLDLLKQGFRGGDGI